MIVWCERRSGRANENKRYHVDHEVEKMYRVDSLRNMRFANFTFLVGSGFPFLCVAVRIQYVWYIKENEGVSKESKMMDFENV